MNYDTNATVASLTIGGAASGTQTFSGSFYSLNAGTVTVNSNGVFSLTSANFTGNLSVAGDGTFNGDFIYIDGQVTVGNGGLMEFADNCTLNGNIATNNWLWVQNGGQLEAGLDTMLQLDAPLTNSGTCNLDGSDLTVDNSATNLYAGAIVNLAGGLINLDDYTEINGQNGYDYMLNEGTIVVSNGSGGIGTDNFTNSGTVDVESGTLDLYGPATFLPAGTLIFEIDVSTEYGSIEIDPEFTVDLTSLGTVVMVLEDGYVPDPGTEFSPVSFSGSTGYLINPRLDPQVTWQTIYEENSVVFAVESSNPEPVLTFSQSTVTRGSPGQVTLEVTNLSPGDRILVQKYIDLDTNGIVDEGDMLVQQFEITDGQGSPVIDGVTNFNVPGDLDPLRMLSGSISAQLGPVRWN